MRWPESIVKELASRSRKDQLTCTTILVQKEFREQDPDLLKFKEGISFDLTDYVKDFFTQDIADKLQNNMESIVEHNEAKYKENMYDDESIKFNIHWFNYKYGTTLDSNSKK